MKILAYTSPARGHLYPIVPIMAALIERGHHASVRTVSDELGHLTGMGIAASPIDPVVESNRLADWRERSVRRAALSVLATIAERAGSDAPDLERAIGEYDPDVLLVDINCWGAATAAEASGLPRAIYSPYLLPMPSGDLPPVGPGLARLGGPLGNLRDAVAARIVSSVFDRAAMPTINALRVQRGLQALDHYSDVLDRAPLLLGLTAEVLEYPGRDWPANVRLVGPINWTPPDTAPVSLAGVSDPLVLVTCSTERQADEALVSVALQGLPAAGMSVIATTAAHDPQAFTAPTGSKAIRFGAHEVLLERAACVVCHGGMGITQKALAAGVPVVVVPFGRDQFETARRVEVAGAGVRLPRRHLTPDRLAGAVRRALELRAGAQTISRVVASAGGPTAAADALEALANPQAVRSAASPLSTAPRR